MTKTTESTTSNTDATAAVLMGAVIVAGIVGLAWLALGQHAQRAVDPLAEADRRITELEGTLHRLEDSFSQLEV
jgi:hypothetical protein